MGTDTPIVFLHGRGANRDPDGWIDAVRTSIQRAGHTPPGIDSGRFVGVSYSDLLRRDAELGEAPMPATTATRPDPQRRVAVLEDARGLAQRWRPPQTLLSAQQLSDLLSHATVARFPLAYFPLQDRGLVDVVTAIMGDVKRYGADRAMRAAVLQRVLEALPGSGEIVLVGHSLGSVVALDVLAHLPGDVHVPLLLTTGSPLAYRPIRDIGLPGASGSPPFPNDRVDRWVNVVEPLDLVTGMSGLRTWWPEVVDVGVRNPRGARHAPRSYLTHEVVGEVIGEARGVSRVPARIADPGTEVERHHDPPDLDERATLIAISLHHARVLTESEDDAATRQRARHARSELHATLGAATGRTLTIDGCERALQRWRVGSPHLERLLLLARLHLSDPFAPFDPGISQPARRRGLRRLADELAIEDAHDAVDDLLDLSGQVRAAVLPRSRARFLRPALVGVGAFAMTTAFAPAAVALFAAAGVTGAAALAGGPSRGPGGSSNTDTAGGERGVVFDLLEVSSLARGGTDTELVEAELLALGATVRWLRRWGDDGIARRAAHAEDDLRRQLRSYEEQLEFHRDRSSPSSEVVRRLERTVETTTRLRRWLQETAGVDAAHRERRTAAGDHEAAASDDGDDSDDGEAAASDDGEAPELPAER